MSRADRITPRTKQTEYYSDFMINLDQNPISGEIARVTNERAVIRSMKHLILTDKEERPCELDTGSNIKRILFEPMDDVSKDLLSTEITNTIQQHEPRVNLTLVNVVAREDDNSYYVTITFTMVNAPSEVLSFSTILYRVR